MHDKPSGLREDFHAKEAPPMPEAYCGAAAWTPFLGKTRIDRGPCRAKKPSEVDRMSKRESTRLVCSRSTNG